MVCKVHKYADGGKVVKRETNLKPHVPPRRKSPILEKAGDPGGPHTPGAKAKRKKAKGKKMADGGKVGRKSSKKKPKPSMLGTGMAAKAGEALRDTRAKQMKDLGI